MANFTQGVIDAPVLTTPTAVGPATPSAVPDLSGAIKTAGSLALDLHKESQSDKLREGLTNEIKGYEQEFLQDQTDVSAEMEGEDLTAQEALAEFEEGASITLSQADKEYAKLSDFLAQGATSELGLKARVETLTRQYINRAPALAAEFRSMRDSVLGDYSATIDIIEKSRTAATKQQDAFIKQARTQAFKYGVDPVGNFEQWYPQVQEKLSLEERRMDWERKKAVQATISEVQLASPEYQDTGVARLNNLSSTIRDIGRMSDKNAAEKEVLLNEAYGLFKAEYANEYPAGKGSNVIESYIASGDRMLKTAIATNNGQITADEAKNRNNILTETSKNKLLQHKSIATVAAMSQITGETITALVLKSSIGVDFISDAMDAVAGSVDGSYTENVNMPTVMNEWTSQAVEQGAAKKDIEPINKSIETMLTGINTSPDSRGMYTKLVNDWLSKPESKEYLHKYAPASVVANATSTVKNGISSIVGAVQKAYDPKTMELGLREDGGVFMTATTSDANTIKMVANINNSLDTLNASGRALAHIQNSTRYEQFGEKIFEALQATPEPTEVPRKDLSPQGEGESRIVPSKRSGVIDGIERTLDKALGKEKQTITSEPKADTTSKLEPGVYEINGTIVSINKDGLLEEIA